MNVKKILYLLTFLVAGLVFASSTEGQQKPEKYNPVPDIMHHISDSHSWHFWGEGEKSVSLSLPIILLDNGLKVFSSAKFGHHEDEVAEVDGNYYKLYHNKIYKTDAAGRLTCMKTTLQMQNLWIFQSQKLLRRCY